jgi:hypothetical protein
MRVRRSLVVVLGLSAALLAACGRGEAEVLITESTVPDFVVQAHADPTPEIEVRFAAENRGDETARACVLRWSLNGKPAETAPGDPDATPIPPGETRTFSAQASFPSDAGFGEPISSEAHVECANARSQVVRDAVWAYVESDAEARLTAVYEDAYRRHPPDAPDEWGSLDDWHRGLEQARAAEAAGDADW